MSKRKYREACYWKVREGVIWVQVSMADKHNKEVLERSRRTRRVADVFRGDGLANEVIYETSIQVLKDLGLSIPPLKEKRVRSPNKRNINSTKERIAEAALSMKNLFKASEVVEEGVSLNVVRAVLRGLVEKGRLESIPKKGYRPK